jgi:indoleamine 2,3-dioxygenase
MNKQADLSQVLFNYDVDVERGFLPSQDPPTALPTEPPGDFSVFDEIGNNLPSLLVDGTLENEIRKLPVFNLNDTGRLEASDAHLLKTRLDFLIHGHAWEKWREGKVRAEIPACLAVPELDISYRFGEPPLLFYPSYSLRNFYRIDQGGPMSPENLELIQYFLGSESERWFVILHIAIEAAATKALVASWQIGDAIPKGDTETLFESLSIIASAMREVNTLMRRMPEKCDMMEYFTSVRPYLYGWIKKYFPNGMLYRGERECDDARLFHRGETGAQSSIFPLLDLLFGIKHAESVLSEHLHEMLHIYTQPKHRGFVLAIGNRPHFSEENIASFGCEVEKLYWECRRLMAEFRAVHFYYAIKYIQEPAALVAKLTILGSTGTGGTEFIPSLWKHFTETLGDEMVQKMGGASDAFTALIQPFSFSDK